jgi:hypothetical protein
MSTAHLIATLRVEPTANTNGLTIQVYEVPAEERFCVVAGEESYDQPNLGRALALAAEFAEQRLT